jgi:hypothetical protein
VYVVPSPLRRPGVRIPLGSATQCRRIGLRATVKPKRLPRAPATQGSVSDSLLTLCLTPRDNLTCSV